MIAHFEVREELKVSNTSGVSCALVITCKICLNRLQAVKRYFSVALILMPIC